MTEARGRTERQEEQRTERRRRDDAHLDGGQAMNLAIPEEIKAKLAEQGREARWVNDTNNRLHQLTKLDDWDLVAGVEPKDVVVDRVKGNVVKSYLCSKPKSFIGEDQRKKDAIRIQTEQAMLRGNAPNAPTPGAPPQPSTTYVVEGSKIERGNQLL